MLGGPRILSVDDGSVRPQRNTDVVVSAEVTGATSVSLEYRVMFSNPVVIAMRDDAASVGGAGDGVFSAKIPGQSARTLVRYRVTATGPDSQATSPSSSDGASLHGFVVDDPNESIDLPSFDVFMPPADYSLMLAKHRYDNRKFPITVALGDQVVTDALVRVRGGVSRRFPKPSLKIELPSGSLMSFPGVDAPVDEFNLYRNPDPVPDIGWDLAGAAGLHEADFEPMRSYLNGDYWGTGAYLTATDGRFRDANGIGDAAVYKQETKMQTTSNAAGQLSRWEKDEGTDGDYTDIWEFTNAIYAVLDTLGLELRLAGDGRSCDGELHRLPGVRAPLGFDDQERLRHSRPRNHRPLVDADLGPRLDLPTEVGQGRGAANSSHRDTTP